MPDPLFTFAAYLGAVIGGWTIAALCLVAVFVQSFLRVAGALPFWDDLRRRTWAQSTLRVVSAAVVGLLLAALYNPVWTAGIKSPMDSALAMAAFLALLHVDRDAMAGRRALCVGCGRPVHAPGRTLVSFKVHANWNLVREA